MRKISFIIVLSIFALLFLQQNLLAEQQIVSIKQNEKEWLQECFKNALIRAKILVQLKTGAIDINDEQYIGAKVIALQEIEEAFEVIKGNREKIKVYIENNKNTLPDDFSNILKDINYVASLDIDADQRLNVFMKTLGYDCNKLWNYFVMSLVYLGAVALLAIGIVVIGDAIIMLIPDPSILGPIAIGVLQLTMLAGMVIELGLAVVAAFLIIINNTAFLALPLCWMGLI